MSINGNRIGGQYPSKPLSKSDKRKLWFWAAVGFGSLFGYPIYRVIHWVFW